MADTNDHMDVDVGEQPQQVPQGASSNPLEQRQEEKKPAKKRFEVKKWTAVAFWSWVENCAICRNHLMDPCIECQPNSITGGEKECIAAWGACNHAFHLHCIKRWLKTRNACPLDNQEWTYQKLGN